MIKAKIKFDDVDKDVQIPISWDEVTWGQFLKILTANGDISQLLSIFMDVSHGTILRAKIQGLEQFLIALRFIKQDVTLIEQPTKIGPHKLPADITFESVEKFETMSKLIQECNRLEDIVLKTEYLARYCAIYLEIEELKQYSCVEVMSAGRFFMAKVKSLETGLPMNFLISRTQTKNGKLDLTASTKLLASMQPSTTLLGTVGKTMKKSVNGRSKGSTRKSSSSHGKHTRKKGIKK